MNQIESVPPDHSMREIALEETRGIQISVVWFSEMRKAMAMNDFAYATRVYVKLCRDAVLKPA